jgi:hypothetical protein
LSGFELHQLLDMASIRSGVTRLTKAINAGENIQLLI